MRLRDWFDIRAIVDCYTTSFYVFLGDEKYKAKKKNWKFYSNDVSFYWCDEEEPT